MKNCVVLMCVAFCAAALTEREAPVIRIVPFEPQIVLVGESVLLFCSVTAGIPAPVLTWVRGDRAPLSRNVEQKSSGTILISNITFADAGQYECRATNTVGETKFSTTIIVHQAPEIRISPNVTELTLIEGDELKLACFAKGLPSPSVYWIKPTPNPRKSRGSRGLSNSESPFAPETPSAGLFHKYNVDRNDEGIYVCHALNDVGEDQKSIKITIEPSPAIPPASIPLTESSRLKNSEVN